MCRANVRSRSPRRVRRFLRLVGASSSPPCGEHVVARAQLSRLGLLGTGGFGTVSLCRDSGTGKTFALKELNQMRPGNASLQKSAAMEKQILLMTHSPFIIKLYECYVEGGCVSFLLEPALGGELFTIYERFGFCGSTPHAQFYSAGVSLAFEYLHKHSILYRDLKPENVLLSAQGHVKLADFGLSTFISQSKRAYTICGTPDYWAPEVVLSKGYGQAMDWWTLGIFVFELMAGHVPFESQTQILKGIDVVELPRTCQGHVGDLVKQLLRAEPDERLPMRPFGIDEFRRHSWYAGFDWERMQSMELRPPFCPALKSDADLSNFAPEAEIRPHGLQSEIHPCCSLS